MSLAVYSHFALVFGAGWLALSMPTKKAQMLPASAMFLLAGTFVAKLGSAPVRSNLSLAEIDILAKTTLYSMLHLSSVLALERWALPPGSLPWRARLYAAYKLLWNPRWVGTRLQPPNTPPPRPGSTSQTRLAFLGGRLANMACLVTLSFAYSAVLAPLGRREDDYDYRRQALTARQAAVRTDMVLSMYFLTGPMVYLLLHDALACFFVAVGLDEPHEWVPLFGRLSETYTMRRYWSGFNNRLLYRPLQLWLRAVLRLVFGFGTPSRPWTGYRRVLLNFLTFLASGIFHAWALHIAGPQRCGQWQELQFWCVQFGLVAVESAAEHLLGRKGRPPSAWERALGYLWVFAVFFWSVPRFQFVQVLCLPEHHRFPA